MAMRWAMHNGETGIRQRGFTLVEVMVTLIIMTIGLLGVASLQLAGMRSNHSAYLRTQAAIAVSDLIDRMRADPVSFNGEHFQVGSDSNSAAFADWATELGRLMPYPAEGEPLGEANCVSGSGNACPAGNCQVIVRWDDRHGEHAIIADEARRSGNRVFSVCTRLAQ